MLSSVLFTQHFLNTLECPAATERQEEVLKLKKRQSETSFIQKAVLCTHAGLTSSQGSQAPLESVKLVSVALRAPFTPGLSTAQ